MTLPDSSTYIYRTATNALGASQSTDGLSEYQKAPAYVIQFSLGTLSGDTFTPTLPLGGYSINPDYNATNTALPNGDVPIGSDSLFSAVIDQIRLVSKNKLRNDAPGGYTPVYSSGNLTGITLNETIGGYSPNTTIECTIGAGGNGIYKAFSGTIDGSGNISGFTYDGNPLSSTNSITGPWDACTHIHVQPRPVPTGETRVKFDFGPGISFIRDTAPYALANDSAFLSCTFAHSIATKSDGVITPAIAQSGTAIIGRVTNDDPDDIWNQMEFYTAYTGHSSKAGSDLCNPINIGRGIFGEGQQDKGLNTVNYSKYYIDSVEIPNFVKDVEGGYYVAVRNTNTSNGSIAAFIAGNDTDNHIFQVGVLNSATSVNGASGAAFVWNRKNVAFLFGSDDRETFRMEPDGTAVTMRPDAVMNLYKTNLRTFANSSPADGDLWYDGSSLKFRQGSTTKTVTLT